MFPYLDFAVVSFVLFAGFGLGALFGYFLKDINFKSFFDGDGGELVRLPDLTDVNSQSRGNLAQIIPFPGRRARRRKAS
jgi:hypothetical protein